MNDEQGAGPPLVSPAHGLHVGILAQMAATAGLQVEIVRDARGQPGSELRLAVPARRGQATVVSVVVQAPPP